METIAKDNFIQIVSLLPDLKYREVCKFWSQILIRDYISDTPTRILKKIPLTPFFISLIERIYEGKRNGMIVSINRPLEIKVGYYEGMIRDVIFYDADNYVTEIAGNLKSYRKRNLTRSMSLNMSMKDQLYFLIVDFINHRAINCLVNLSKVTDKERFDNCFNEAVKTFRTPENLTSGFSGNSLPMAIKLMKNFPSFELDLSEVYSLINKEEGKFSKEVMEDIIYVFDHGWFERLEKIYYTTYDYVSHRHLYNNFSEIRRIYLDGRMITELNTILK